MIRAWAAGRDDDAAGDALDDDAACKIHRLGERRICVAPDLAELPEAEAGLDPSGCLRLGEAERFLRELPRAEVPHEAASRRSRIENYADDIPGTGTYWSAGRLNACNAAAASLSACPLP
jgi:hypothetical protein